MQAMTVALYPGDPTDPTVEPIEGTIREVELVAPEDEPLAPRFGHEVVWNGPWGERPAFMALRTPAGEPLATWQVVGDWPMIVAPAGWLVPMPPPST